MIRVFNGQFLSLDDLTAVVVAGLQAIPVFSTDVPLVVGPGLIDYSVFNPSGGADIRTVDYSDDGLGNGTNLTGVLDDPLVTVAPTNGTITILDTVGVRDDLRMSTVDAVSIDTLNPGSDNILVLAPIWADLEDTNVVSAGGDSTESVVRLFSGDSVLMAADVIAERRIHIESGNNFMTAFMLVPMTVPGPFANDTDDIGQILQTGGTLETTNLSFGSGDVVLNSQTGIEVYGLIANRLQAFNATWNGALDGDIIVRAQNDLQLDDIDGEGYAVTNAAGAFPSGPFYNIDIQLTGVGLSMDVRDEVFSTGNVTLRDSNGDSAAGGAFIIVRSCITAIAGTITLNDHEYPSEGGTVWVSGQNSVFFNANACFITYGPASYVMIAADNDESTDLDLVLTSEDSFTGPMRIVLIAEGSVILDGAQYESEFLGVIAIGDWRFSDPNNSGGVYVIPNSGSYLRGDDIQLQAGGADSTLEIGYYNPLNVIPQATYETGFFLPQSPNPLLAHQRGGFPAGTINVTTEAYSPGISTTYQVEVRTVPITSVYTLDPALPSDVIIRHTGDVTIVDGGIIYEAGVQGLQNPIGSITFSAATIDNDPTVVSVIPNDGDITVNAGISASRDIALSASGNIVFNDVNVLAAPTVVDPDALRVNRITLTADATLPAFMPNQPPNIVGTGLVDQNVDLVAITPTTITATELVVYAADGITLPNTVVSAFQGINTVGYALPGALPVAGASGHVFIENTGDLLLTDLDGPGLGGIFSIINGAAGGDVTVIAHSDITVAAPIVAVDDVVLSAEDAAGSSIFLNASISTTGGAGSIIDLFARDSIVDDGNQNTFLSTVGRVILTAELGSIGDGGLDGLTTDGYVDVRLSNVGTLEAQAPGSVFVQEVGFTPALGSIVTIAGAGIVDGDTILVSDGVNTYLFEFDDDATNDSGGDFLVSFTGADTADVVAGNLAAAIGANLGGLVVNVAGNAISLESVGDVGVGSVVSSNAGFLTSDILGGTESNLALSQIVSITSPVAGGFVGLSSIAGDLILDRTLSAGDHALVLVANDITTVGSVTIASNLRITLDANRVAADDGSITQSGAGISVFVAPQVVIDAQGQVGVRTQTAELEFTAFDPSAAVANVDIVNIGNVVISDLTGFGASGFVEGNLDLGVGGNVVVDTALTSLTGDVEIGSTGAVSVFAPITAAAGQEVDIDALTGITVESTITVTGGTITLFTDNGNLEVGATQTAGSVFWTSVNGAVRDLSDAPGENPNVVAANLTITSGTGVGTIADRIETAVGNLTVNGGGDAYLSEANSVAVAVNTSGTFDIVLGAGGILSGSIVAPTAVLVAPGGINLASTTIGTLTASATEAGADIALTETNGLALLTVTANDDVTITLIAGAITDANGSAVNVTAADASLTAPGGIDTDTNVDTLTTVSSGSDQFIDEASGLTALNLNAGAGNVTLTAGGTITDTDAATDVTAFAVSLHATQIGSTANPIETNVSQLTATATGAAGFPITPGSIWIDEASSLTAVNLTAGGIGVITLTAGGFITDNDPDVDFQGLGADVTATSFGTLGSPIQTSLSQLTVTVSGLGVNDIYVSETDGLTALNLSASNSIVLVAGGSVTDGDVAADLTAQTATVTATSINLDTDVTTLIASATGGDVVIDEANGLAATITATGTADIEVLLGGLTGSVSAPIAILAAQTLIDVDTTVGTLTATTAAGGSITIDEADSVVLSGVNASATGTVTIRAQGPVTGGAGTDVTANLLDITSPAGINLDTAVNTLVASATAGDVVIRNTVALNATVTAGNAAVLTLAAGALTGDITAPTAVLTAPAGIDITSAIGTLTASSTNAGAVIDVTDDDSLALLTVSAEDVILTVLTGAITDANGSAVNISAIDATLTAPNGIDTDTAVSTLTTSGGGVQRIDELDGLSSFTLDAGTGTVVLTAGGVILDGDVTAFSATLSAVQIGSAADPIQTNVSHLTATATGLPGFPVTPGHIWIDEANSLTSVNLTAGGIGVITLTAGGFIIDGDSDVDFSGFGADVTATSFGQAGSPIQTSVSQLTVTVSGFGANNIFVAETDGLTALDLSASDDVVLTAGGSIVDGDGATDIVADSATVTATSINIGTDVDELIATATAGDVIIDEVDDLLATVVATGTADIELSDGTLTGTITAASAILDGPDGVNVQTVVGTLSVNSDDGSVQVFNTGDLLLTSASADGSINVIASGTFIVNGSVTAGLDVELSSGEDFVAVDSTISAGGSIRIDSLGDLTIDPTFITAAGDIDLVAAGALSILESTVTSTGGSVSLTAGGVVTVTDSDVVSQGSAAPATGFYFSDGTDTLNGEFIVISDGVTTYTFEFDTDGINDSGGDFLVDVSAAGGLGDNYAIALLNAINNAGFGVSATFVGLGQIDLANANIGGAGNVQITTSLGAAFGFGGMSGGSLAGTVTVNGNGGVNLTNALLEAQGGVRVESAGGPVNVNGSTLDAGLLGGVGAAVEVVGAAGVVIRNSDLFADGNIEITATGGNVAIDASGAGSALLAGLETAGDVLISASGSISIGAPGVVTGISTPEGDIVIDAGTTVTMTESDLSTGIGGISIDGTNLSIVDGLFVADGDIALTASVDVSASGDFTADADLDLVGGFGVSAGRHVSLDGSFIGAVVDVFAGGNLLINGSVEATNDIGGIVQDELNLAAAGTITADADFRSAGGIHIQGVAGITLFGNSGGMMLADGLISLESDGSIGIRQDVTSTNGSVDVGAAGNVFSNAHIRATALGQSVSIDALGSITLDGQITVDTTTNGLIQLFSDNGNLEVGGTQTAFTILWTANNGAVRDLADGGAGVNPNAVATNLTITAAAGVGTASDRIETAVTNLIVNGGGSVYLSEADGVAVTVNISGTFDIVLGAGALTGSIIAPAAVLTAPAGITLSAPTALGTLTATVSGGDITVTEADNLALMALSASGTITLTVGGSITDANGAATNISATSAVLTAPTGIDTDTAVASLTTNGGGTQAIDEFDGLSGLNLNAGSGSIVLTAGGTITDGDGATVDVTALSLTVNAVAFGAAGAPIDTNVSELTVTVTGVPGTPGLINVSEASALTAVNLQAGSTGTITLVTGVSSIFGFITDNDPDVDFAGEFIDVTADAFGEADRPIQTSAGVLIVNTTGGTPDGSQFIVETDNLTGLNLNAGTGNVTLTAGGAILDTVGAPDVTATTATITATSMTLDTAVTNLIATATAGNVVIDESDGLNATVSATGTADIDLAAGSLTGTIIATAAILDAPAGINVNTTVGTLTATTTGSDITINETDGVVLGNVNAGTADVSITAQGLVTGGTVTANDLTVVAPAGIDLTTAVDTLVASAAAGDVVIRDAGDLVATVTAGNTANLDVAGALTTPVGGRITAQTAILDAASIDVDTTVANLTATASGAITIDETDSVSVNVVSGTTVTINLSAGTLTGSIEAATADLDAPAIDVDTEIGTLIATGGSLVVNETNDLILNGVNVTTANITAGGSITATDDLTVDLTAGTATLTAGGAITLDTSVGVLNATTSSGNISIDETDSLAVSISTPATADIDLAAGSLTGTINALTAILDAPVTIDVNTTVGTLTATAATLIVDETDGLLLNDVVVTTATITAGGAISNFDNGDVNLTATTATLTGASIDLDTDVTTLTATATAGNVVIDEANGLSATITATGTADIELTNGALTGSITAAEAILVAPAGIDVQTSVGRLTVTSTGGDVDVFNTGDLILSGASGVNITIEASGDLLSNGAVTAGGSVTFDALGTITIDQDVNAGTTVDLLAGGDLNVFGDIDTDNGSITLDAEGAVLVEGVELDADNGDLTISGASVTLDTVTIFSDGLTTVTGLGAVSLTNVLLFSDDDTVISGTTVTLDTVDLTSIGDLTVTATGLLSVLGDSVLESDLALTLSGHGVVTDGGVFFGLNGLSILSTADAGLVADFIGSEGQVSIQATGDMTISLETTLVEGIYSEFGDVTIDAGGDLSIYDDNGDPTFATILAGGQIDIAAGGNLYLEGNHVGDQIQLEGYNVAFGGTADAVNGNFEAFAIGTYASDADYFASGNVVIEGLQGVTLLGNSGGDINAGGAVSINSGANLSLSNMDVDAVLTITLTATGALSMSNGHIDAEGADLAGQSVLISGASVSLDGVDVFADGALTITSVGAATLLNTDLDADTTITILAGSLSVTGGSLLTDAGNITVDAAGVTFTNSDIDAGASIDIGSTAALAISGTDLDAVLTITLTATGALSVSNGDIDAEGADLAGQSVLISGNTVSLDTVDVFADGLLTISAVGALTLLNTELDADTTIELTAGGALSATDSDLFTDTGDVILAAGSISLSGGGIDAGASVDIQSAGDVAIEFSVIDAVNGIDILSGGDLSVSGDSLLDAGDAFLFAFGDVSLSAAGDVSIADSDLVAEGDVTLDAGGNVSLVNAAVAANQGDVEIAGADISVVEGLIFGFFNVDIAASGDVLLAAETIIADDLLSVTAAGSIVVSVTTDNGNHGLESTLGSIVLTAGGNVVISDGDSSAFNGLTVTALNEVRIVAGGSIEQATGQLVASDLVLYAATGISVLVADVDFLQASNSISGALVVYNVGPLTLQDLDGIGHAVENEGGDIVIETGSSLPTPGTEHLTVVDSVVASGSVTFEADGNLIFNLSIDEEVSGTELVFEAQGSITQTGGTVAGDSLEAEALTGISLNNLAVNQAQLLNLVSGNVTVVDAGDLTLTDLNGNGYAVSNDNGAVSVTTDGDLTIASDIEAGLAVNLTALSGSILQTAGVIQGTTLTATAVSGILLGQTDVDVLNASTSSTGDILVSNLGNLTVAVVTAADGDVTLRTTLGGDMILGSVTALGHAITIESAGDVDEGSPDFAPDLTALEIFVTANDGIGDLDTIEIDATRATLTVNANGGINVLDSANGLDLIAATTPNGVVRIDSIGGPLIARLVVAGGAGNDAFVRTTGPGDILLGLVQAADQALIDSQQGSIFDGNDQNGDALNVQTGGDATMTAAGVIGTLANCIEIEIGNNLFLAAGGGAGGASINLCGTTGGGNPVIIIGGTPGGTIVNGLEFLPLLQSARAAMNDMLDIRRRYDPILQRVLGDTTIWPPEPVEDQRNIDPTKEKKEEPKLPGESAEKKE